MRRAEETAVVEEGREKEEVRRGEGEVEGVYENRARV